MIMKLPTSVTEEKLSEKGRIVIGVDEVGRGPLAGPVVSAASWVNPDFFDVDFKEKDLIRDSKTLSEKQRKKIYDIMVNEKSFFFGRGDVSERIIDKINILNASLLAMRLAVEDILPKIEEALNIEREECQKRVVVLVDGNKEIPGIKLNQISYLKGDQKIFSISIASIYAKVVRDKLMDDYHREFPDYGFNSNRGYGTKKHLTALMEKGPCLIHRRSFAPVKKALESDKTFS